MDIHFRDINHHKDLTDIIKNANENNKEVHLEIGFGSGIVLRERAKIIPDSLHIGFEMKNKFVKRVQEYGKKYNLNNMFLKQCDAKYVIPRFIPIESLDKIYIYYPDPWWKNKHKKYILFDFTFITDLYRALKPNGILYVKTDVIEYYQIIKERFDKFAYFKEVPFDDLASINNVSTFEQKGLMKGHILSQIALQK